MARRTAHRARPQSKRVVAQDTSGSEILTGAGGLGFAAGAPDAPLSVSRPELRAADPRGEDPRARAARRAAELRDHGVGQDDGIDDFAIPADMIPDGWDYEWKRQTVLGAEDPAYQVQTARAGWEPVPAARHPSFMPKGWPSGSAIERKGMVLMERPKEISDEARRRELQKARLQVRTKEEQLNQTPQGTLPRDEDARTKARIKKEYEPMPIPE